MATEIFEGMTGRNISNYDLLDEAVEKYGLGREEAHEAIGAMLRGIIEADGDGVVLDRRPVRPELLTRNEAQVDVTYWLTVSDGTAAEIREALAAVYAA